MAGMSHPILVVYDVGDDDRRQALRAELSLSGQRVQQSTWLLAPGRSDNPARVVARTNPLLDPGDRLRALQPCASCVERLRWWPRRPHPLGWLEAQSV